MRCDVIIVGAGPVGIFTAYELKKRDKDLKILMIEKGHKMEKRKCPKKANNDKCIYCKPTCAITTGFSGAGAFSDGKLSLSPDVGGYLQDYVGRQKAEEIIKYVDNIYLSFGADTNVEGLVNNEEVDKIRKRAEKAALKFVECPVRHLGTEKAQDLYLALQNHLMDSGVEILFNTKVEELSISEEGAIRGVIVRNMFTREYTGGHYAPHIVLAVGREGSHWLSDLCKEYDIKWEVGPVDIGVRVEVPNRVMEIVNKNLYEGKFIGSFQDDTRSFCQNPGGHVKEELYDERLVVANGHSYKENKTDNTNLAILSSHKFTAPFDQPIEFAKSVASLTNMLGKDKIIVQRYGDIKRGGRSKEEDMDLYDMKPTLIDAVPGDITCALPHRTMKNIISFIEAMDLVCPGFASAETLLYAPEVKLYSNRLVLDEKFETNIKGLYAGGDGAGVTRGLMQASCNGVLIAQSILEKREE